MAVKKAEKRSDREPSHRRVFEKNRKRILQSQNICAICGKPVNKKLKFPDPMAPTVDHIVPVSKGGHPSDIGNLQLAHFICNRLKSDKLAKPIQFTDDDDKLVSNRNLPLSYDWNTYKG